MTITCDCSTDDFEPASVYVESWRRARKEHKCCECHAPIRVGERHQFASGLWDGAWGSFRTCKACADIIADRCPSGYQFGGLRETLWECLGLDYVSGEVAGWATKEDAMTAAPT